MKTCFHFAATGLLACCLSLAAFAQDMQAFSTGMIPADHILMPDSAPEASIFLISGAAGWGAAEDKEAAGLAAKGAAVIGIDFPTYLKTLQ
ncbi:MAG: virulence factor family protein, partial [Shinella sp.]